MYADDGLIIRKHEEGLGPEAPEDMMKKLRNVDMGVIPNMSKPFG